MILHQVAKIHAGVTKATGARCETEWQWQPAGVKRKGREVHDQPTMCDMRPGCPARAVSYIYISAVNYMICLLLDCPVLSRIYALDPYKYHTHGEHFQALAPLAFPAGVPIKASSGHGLVNK